MRVRPAWRLATVVGLIGVLTLVPAITDFDAQWGLAMLFRLRGPVAAPESVVIVAMDREAARALDLPAGTRVWPRSVHAKLLDRLHAAGASVIAFDIFFDGPREAASDRALAGAIRRAGNVVLFEYLQRDELAAGGVRERTMTIEQRLRPYAPFADAAAATAPFSLPKLPASVNAVWLFKEGAGDAPTLPAVAFALHARAEHALLDAAAGSETLTAQMTRFRARFTNRSGAGPGVPAPLDTGAAMRVAALADLYRGASSRHLNFYGPPRTLMTIPISRVLLDESSLPLLRGKAVFTGYSETHQPDQKDGFVTPFTRDDGLDLSGVEIAATAFANLHERRFLDRLALPAEAAMLGLWGFGMVFMLMAVPRLLIVPLAMAAGILYVATAYAAFTRINLWLPLLVPLAIQLPSALIGALIVQYTRTAHQRRRLHAAYARHVPAETLAATLLSDAPRPPALTGAGVCLATDAQGFTALAEKLPPTQLRAVMNRYFSAIVEPVRTQGGYVADIAGDSIIAIFRGDDALARQHACRAALNIAQAADTFNRAYPETPLPTRIGLHCGAFVLGEVGGGDRHAWRALGDTVNSANRIEQLNKTLGTRVLASQRVAADLDAFVSRRLGLFQVAGRREALDIVELLGFKREAGSEADAALHARVLKFGAALASYNAGRFVEAASGFTGLLALCADDGPSRYYLDLCQQRTGQDDRRWNDSIASPFTRDPD